MAKQDKNATFVGDSRVPAKRIPNISPSYSDFPGKSEPFWPNFLLKEWMVAAVCLLGFLALIVSQEPPLTAKANPNDTSFIPLPDWYFLFLYQLLKYPWAAGDWVVIGILGVPGVAFGALLLAPWLDNGKERRPFRRPVATGLMLIAVISIFYLTWAAMDEHKRNHPETPENAVAPAPAPSQNADPSFVADEIWTAQASCINCHGGNMEGTPAAPGLQDVGSRYSAEEIEQIIAEGKGIMPGNLIADEAERKKLAEYLASLK